MENQIKETVLTNTWINVKVHDIFWTLGLAMASIVAPALLAHTPANQWITGTIVNALIFISAWRVGIVNAAVVAIFPSTIALLRGLLPAPMALLIPYIIISNLLLILVFSWLKKRALLSVVLASTIKFLFLYLIASLLTAKLASPLIAMMQWPQLVTAMAGGLIAIGITNKWK